VRLIIVAPPLPDHRTFLDHGAFILRSRLSRTEKVALSEHDHPHFPLHATSAFCFVMIRAHLHLSPDTAGVLSQIPLQIQSFPRYILLPVAFDSKPRQALKMAVDLRKLWIL
jgi:hypothetical protein